MKGEWITVTKQHGCKICQKFDWCGFSSDGLLICCMRVKSNKTAKNGGWIHETDKKITPYIPPRKPEPKVIIDAHRIFMAWLAETRPTQMIKFASSLGVDPMSLHSIGCAWSHEKQAWAFPMKDKQKIVGIRLRSPEGDKWSVKGSRSGLFTPNHYHFAYEPLYVCEGVTDAAAALTMGLNAIGRPSCMGSEDQVNWYIQNYKIRQVIIVADNDTPGINGANKLQEALKVTSCVMMLPTKDIREFLQAGGTKLDILNIMKNLVWKKASIPLRQ